MSTPISVLRIGPSTQGVSTGMLKTALCSHFSSSSDEGPVADGTLLVSNRYFTAEVQLKDLESKDSDPRSFKEDGIVLVFDSLQSNPDIGSHSAQTFDSLTMVHDKAEADDKCGDLLRLCVGVHIGDISAAELRGKKHEDEYSRRVLWCLDRGYEYVEADISEQGRAKGHDERDKDGYARVIEAIAGTVWSSAKMGQRKKLEVKERNKEALQEVNGKETGAAVSAPLPEGSDAGANSSTQQDTKEPEIAQAESENGYLEVPGEKAGTSQKDVEQEKIFDDLEGLLRQASRIRDMSRSGSLTDEQRRERAGEAANLMMDLMTRLELGEGDDDEEEEEEESN